MKQKRKIKSFKNSDWLYVTPQHVKLHIMKITTSYWYNPKNKITIRMPLEETHKIMIGKKGYKAADELLTTEESKKKNWSLLKPLKVA
tara:strand:+ start:530 stop:793 length:264 start_codon:yes stop_codon:yes gene_type:complete